MVKLDDFKIIVSNPKLSNFFQITRKNKIVLSKYPNGDKSYFDNEGRLHREDGPALNWPHWNIYKYCWHGKDCTKEELDEYIKNA